MFKLEDKNGILLLKYKDKQVFVHSEESPFITIGFEKLKYKSNHGNFDVKEKKGKSISLNQYKATQNHVTFFNEKLKDLSVELSLKEKNGILYVEPGKSGEFNSISFNFSGNENECIFGGGEQFRKLNLKGEKVKNMVSEHITVPPILAKTLFKRIKKYRVREHSEIQTYSPMSTFVSSDKYAIRVKVASYGVQDFTKKDNCLTYWDMPKSICIVVENDFKKISRKLNSDTPSNVYLPDWVYEGMIPGVQGGIENVKKKVDKMQKMGMKISGVWCQDWSGKKITAVGKQVYWNWEQNSEYYPDLEEEIKVLKKKGVHFLAYINPYLIVESKMYNECKQKGYLIKNPKGEIYHIKSTTFNAGMMDLTNPGMVDYLKNIIIKKNMIDIGIDGYMADFGEYLPVDAILYSGEDAASMHNKWPVMWAKINRDAINESKRKNEVFFFTRSGYNETQKYTTIMWNGDQHTDFYPDYGMPCVIPASINLGFSGMTATHSDIGGYISFSSLKRNKELFIRWLEMNTFSPLIRGHETVRPNENIQFDDKEVVDFSLKFSNLYKKLKPYIKHCMEEAREGIPVMRAPFYEFNDMSLYKEDYVYMFGGELFVAPVINEGQRERKVYLPQGRWIHLLSGKEYTQGENILDAPLGMPVVLYKKDGEYSELFKSCLEK